MLRTILIFGVAAGLIVIVPMGAMLTLIDDPKSITRSLTVGYLVMLLGLSLIFIGIKRHRDRVLGGVIRFVPALLMGLGISVVAGMVYMIGWEITQAATDYGYMETYAQTTIEAARAKGAPPAEIERLTAQMTAMTAQYANPLFRLPMTFIEIFPVGVVISLISAALLRNSRFMPARSVAG